MPISSARVTESSHSRETHKWTQKWQKVDSKLACLAWFANIFIYMFLFLAAFVELWCLAKEEEWWHEEMRKTELQALKEKGGTQNLTLTPACKVNPGLHRLLESRTEEPSDEHCCSGLSVTPEHFPGFRAKLYIEIYWKWFVLKWLGCLWIQQSRTDPHLCNVWSIRKCTWVQLFQPQSPYNITNSNIIWQRFAATLDIR